MSIITQFAQIISRLDRGKFSKLVKDTQTTNTAKDTTVGPIWYRCYFVNLPRANRYRSATGNLNHLGIQKAPSKSTISYQNKHRSQEIFKDYYFSLLEILGQQALSIPDWPCI